MKTYAVRGAITVKENNREQILMQTRFLLEELMKKNAIKIQDIISIIFTATSDLNTEYPAVAARELGMTSIPLICCQEMNVVGSLSKCIRVLMHVQFSEERILTPVYLGKAAILRPDLANLTVAIDGPAGAGKSTVAKLLAKKLNIMYLDTGAMYRAMGLKVIENGGDPSNRDDVIPLLESTDIAVRPNNTGQTVYLDGRDVTDKIRSSYVSKAASDVGTIPEVRKKLVRIQQQIANKFSLVMDGRDIGTYVLPYATLKVFLTASPEERARRRWKELLGRGCTVDFKTVLQEIIERDANDSNRTYAPLRKADDAVLIDSTNKSIEQVVNEIVYLMKS
ncbi:MAG: (d)CMP kinase [Clostridiales bacterium]|jgi:cytidylate kinase|nr:(d)CMP kinase [Clostridiales bacterium]